MIAFLCKRRTPINVHQESSKGSPHRKRNDESTFSLAHVVQSNAWQYEYHVAYDSRIISFGLHFCVSRVG